MVPVGSSRCVVGMLGGYNAAKGWYGGGHVGLRRCPWGVAVVHGRMQGSMWGCNSAHGGVAMVHVGVARGHVGLQQCPWEVARGHMGLQGSTGGCNSAHGDLQGCMWGCRVACGAAAVPMGCCSGAYVAAGEDVRLQQCM